MRYAIVTSSASTLAQIGRYLPSNYEATQSGDGPIFIFGSDVAGWTLDDYVLPRLASGLHFAKELQAAPF